ncbi:MAG: 30S ribosomal protein S9 [Candidatus Micrarchaeia archaeon]
MENAENQSGNANAATIASEVQAQAQAQAQASRVQKEQKPVRRSAKRHTKKVKTIIANARRKMARAKAVLYQGTGRVFLNGKEASTITNKYIQRMLLEPINLSQITKDIAKNYDIKVKVKGGGMSGQVQAARSAIAKAITEASKDEVVKKLYLSYDRFLLIDDTRQVEPKKFKGPKARARFQKSYR